MVDPTDGWYGVQVAHIISGYRIYGKIRGTTFYRTVFCMAGWYTGYSVRQVVRRIQCAGMGGTLPGIQGSGWPRVVAVDPGSSTADWYAHGYLAPPMSRGRDGGTGYRYSIN